MVTEKRWAQHRGAGVAGHGAYARPLECDGRMFMATECPAYRGSRRSRQPAHHLGVSVFEALRRPAMDSPPESILGTHRSLGDRRSGRAIQESSTKYSGPARPPPHLQLVQEYSRGEG